MIFLNIGSKTSIRPSRTKGQKMITRLLAFFKSGITLAQKLFWLYCPSSSTGTPSLNRLISFSSSVVWKPIPNSETDNVTPCWCRISSISLKICPVKFCCTNFTFANKMNLDFARVTATFNMSGALWLFLLPSSKKNHFASVPSLSTESQMITSFSPPWKLCTVFTSIRFLAGLFFPKDSSKISLIKSFCERYGTTTPTVISLPSCVSFAK